MVRASSSSSVLPLRLQATLLLVRHGHVELDRRELFGSHAMFAQEWQPARIRVNVGEHRVAGNRTEYEVMASGRFVQPLEGAIGFAAKSEDIRDIN